MGVQTGVRELSWGDQSLSVSVAVARSLRPAKPVLSGVVPESWMKKISSPSGRESSQVLTEITALVWPAVKARVPVGVM